MKEAFKDIKFRKKDNPSQFLAKAIARQQTLRKLAESPVLIVADPDIVSLDGIPHTDLLYENLNTQQRKLQQKKKTWRQKDFDHEHELMRMDMPSYYMALNRLKHAQKWVSRAETSRSESLKMKRNTYQPPTKTLEQTSNSVS